MAVLVENPLGPLSLGVSSENPYKDCPSSSDNMDDTKWVYFGEHAYQLDNQDITHALELERRSGTVRVLTAIDVFMGILSFTMFGYVPSVLICFISYLGYHGASLYRRGMVIGYLLYQCLLTFTRCCLTVLVFVDHNNTELMVIAPISFLVQLYITSYVWRFYSILPSFGY